MDTESQQRDRLRSHQAENSKAELVFFCAFEHLSTNIASAFATFPGAEPLLLLLVQIRCASTAFNRPSVFISLIFKEKMDQS